MLNIYTIILALWQFYQAYKVRYKGDIPNVLKNKKTTLKIVDIEGFRIEYSRYLFLSGVMIMAYAPLVQFLGNKIGIGIMIIFLIILLRSISNIFKKYTKR